MLRRYSAAILLLLILSSCSKDNHDNITYDYSLGRNPFSSFVSSSGNEVFYKSLVLCVNNGLEEYLYQGLFYKSQAEQEKELIYADFSHGLNLYTDKLYFIDTKHQLIKYDRTTKEDSIIVGNDEQFVSECLVIDDTLFYITEDISSKVCSLNALDLNQNSHYKIADDVYWERLNHFRGNVQFWDINGNPKIYDSVEKTIIEYGSFDMEIVQILDSEIVLGYKNNTFIQCDLDGNNKKDLFSAESIYNIIVTQNEIYYSTVDQEGYTQTFVFSLLSNESRKIATTIFPIVGYSGTYLFCASTTGIGDLQCVDVTSGKVTVFDDRMY